jgi:iron uptake system component EfeO
VLAVGGLVLLAGCTAQNGSTPDTTAARTTVTVTSTADACEVSETEVPAGAVVFTVTNAADAVTEFYLLREDGTTVVSELENLGPGTSRDLVVQLEPGSYLTACKPGMTGEGIRAPLTVTEAGTAAGAADDVTAGSATGSRRAELAAATATYLQYVRTEADQLLDATRAFAASYVAGDDEAARAAYAPARTHWERIEPVAESFGDLDPRMDLREADLEAGAAWTGWHVIEKDLWAPTPDANGGTAYAALSRQDRERIAAQLVADTEELAARVQADDFTVSAHQLGNGAKSLLDEVATGKVTGEEEVWSHTDLWDFQANVDGALVAFQALRDAVAAKDPALVELLEQRFAQVDTLLDQHRVEDGFRSYTDLTTAQVRELAAAVDALGEPLSKLTAAVVL